MTTISPLLASKLQQNQTAGLQNNASQNSVQNTIEPQKVQQDTQPKVDLNEPVVDTYEKKDNKLAKGAAVVSVLGLVAASAVAYKRGKEVNEFKNAETKFFSNIAEGFKTFFGKGKEFYNVNIKKINAEVPNKNPLGSQASSDTPPGGGKDKPLNPDKPLEEGGKPVNTDSAAHASEKGKPVNPDGAEPVEETVEKLLGSAENPIKIDFLASSGETGVTRVHKIGDKYYSITEGRFNPGTTSVFKAREFKDAFEQRAFLRNMQQNNGDFGPEVFEALREKYYGFIQEVSENPERLTQIWGEEQKTIPNPDEFVLRFRDDLLALVRKQKTQLDGLSPRYALKNDTTFWRAISDDKTTPDGRFITELIERAREGDTIIPDWAPMSIAEKFDAASSFSPDSKTFFRIKVPKGAKVWGAHQERLLPSQASFKVTAKNDFDGLKIIDLEYILPD